MPSAHDKYLLEVLLTEEEIQRRIAELGAEISRDYEGHTDLLLVCILKGGVMFLTDLMRHITVPHEVDFMSATSYGAGRRESEGTVRIEMDVKSDLRNRTVLIVEDIIDSGYTLKFVMDTFRARGVRDLKLCTLLNKASRRVIDIPVDYVGFDIENKFVFGYGLDLDEKFRNLPFVGVVDQDVFFNE